MRRKICSLAPTGFVAAALIGISVTGACGAEIAQRVFQVTDLFELEDSGAQFGFGGQFAFSDDGTKLAFVRLRSAREAGRPNVATADIRDYGRGDVWVQLGSSERPIKVTDGSLDGSGWFSPQWSPDGTKLAMLSTRGGDVHLWLWDSERRANKPRQLSQRVAIKARAEHSHPQPYVWLGTDRVLFATETVPASAEERSAALSLGQHNVRVPPEMAAEAASAAWRVAFKGERASVSALRSGYSDAAVRGVRYEGALVLLNTSSSAETVVTEQFATATWAASPDHKLVAFLSPTGTKLELEAGGDLPPVREYENWTLIVIAIDGPSPTIDSSSLPAHVQRDSLRWSPDAVELAFLGYASSDDSTPALYRLNVRSGAVQVTRLEGLNGAPRGRDVFSRLEWTLNGALILEASAPRDPGTQRQRLDWWRAGRDGSVVALTSTMAMAPSLLLPVKGGKAFVGISQGELWEIRPDGGGLRSLTARFNSQVKRFIPDAIVQDSIVPTVYLPRRLRQLPYEHLPFMTDDGSTYVIDVSSEYISRARLPLARTEVVAYAAQSANAVLMHRSDAGPRLLWRKDLRRAAYTTLSESNGFLRGIAGGRFVTVDYISLDGEPLKAWLLLPPDYTRGKRYPLVTWVYPDTKAGAAPDYIHRLDSAYFLNMQIMAAKGYAVLFPSMPRRASRDESGDPHLLRNLPNGVLPAIDRVIEHGIADPTRLVVMGASFGAYATYGLVTQTKRFHAAIALSGPANLISAYGTFSAGQRYFDHAHDEMSWIATLEGGQFLLRVPPFRDWWRYINNSPLFFVDRVETPLMIMHGDLDFVPIEQGEEVFRALHRQGKKAQFVRYWGEGHIFSIPANVNDMWQRIFDWIDENFRSTQELPSRR